MYSSVLPLKFPPAVKTSQPPVDLADIMDWDGGIGFSFTAPSFCGAQLCNLCPRYRFERLCDSTRAARRGARAESRNLSKRYPGHKFVTFYAIAGQSVESIVANFKSSNSPGPALKGLTLPVVVGMSESVKKIGNRYSRIYDERTHST